MKLTSRKKEIPLTPVGGNEVNKVGRYLYENLDGAFKFEKKPNMYDVYITLLYQLLQPLRKTEEDEKVHEMTLDLSITTYQNKLRVNVTQMDENEWTICHFVVPQEKLQDLEAAKNYIFDKVVQKVSKVYKDDYDFIF